LTPDGEVVVSTDDSSSTELEAAVAGEGTAEAVLVGATAELTALSFAPLLFALEHPTPIDARLIRPENKNTLLSTSRLLQFDIS